MDTVGFKSLFKTTKSKRAENCFSVVTVVKCTKKWLSEGGAQSWDLLPVPVLKSAAISYDL